MENLTKTGVKAVDKRIAPFLNSDTKELSLDPLNVAIARLSDSEVARMDRKDLIDLVSYAVLDRLSRESQARLDFVDDYQLKRLACLARFACQRRVNSVFFQHGQQSPFIDVM